MHKKLYHSHNKASQCEEDKRFELFNCFYCDVTIDSEDQLKVHYSTCESEHEILFKLQVMHQDVNSFTCEICGANCRDDLDHYLEVKPEENESDCFQCDICPLYYNKKIDLEFHRRGFHWDQFS